MSGATKASPSGSHADASAVLSAVGPVIDRLSATLEEESNQILARVRVDYNEFNMRKSRALLELMTMKPLLSSAANSPPLTEKLSELVKKIERNGHILGIEVAAARKVSDLIAKAIQDGQSDGTYSEHDWRDDD